MFGAPLFLAQVNQLQGSKPNYEPSASPQPGVAVETQAAHQGTPSESPEPQAGNPMVTLLMMGGLFVFFYFIAIRPQQKQQKEHKSFVSSLKEKDEVVTNAGIIGKIVQLDEQIVRLEVDKSTRIRVLKDQISRRFEPKAAGKQK